MSILKKVNDCECGRKAYGFKKCGVCRSKLYSERSKDRKVLSVGDGVGSFFERHIKHIESQKLKCLECGIPLRNADSRNVAHVLKKSIFKSIATEDLNIMYLCWQHHSDYDSSFEKAKKMKIWSAAVGRVKQMSVLIKERHKDLSHFLD